MNRKQCVWHIICINIVSACILLPGARAEFVRNDAIQNVDPLGLKAYHADCPRHRLAAQDQNMKRYADVATAFAKARATNAKQKWGPVDKGKMEVVAAGRLSKKKFVEAILNDTDPHPQFYGHGMSTYLMWSSAGWANPAFKLRVADLQKIGPQIVNEKHKIDWDLFEIYSCMSAASLVEGPNIMAAISKATGKKVSGNPGTQKIKVEPWLFDKNGKRITDPEMLKPFKALIKKLVWEAPKESAAALYTVERFNKDWAAEAKKNANCTEAYWDVYVKDYHMRKTTPDE